MENDVARCDFEVNSTIFLCEEMKEHITFCKDMGLVLLETRRCGGSLQVTSLISPLHCFKYTFGVYNYKQGEDVDGLWSLHLHCFKYTCVPLIIK